MAEDNNNVNNVIEPTPNPKSFASDANDPVVRSFIDLQEKEMNNMLRIKKMDEVKEDMDILEALTDRVPNKSQIQVKPSLYFKLLRIYDVQASLLPKTFAKKERASQAELSIVDSAKDLIYNDAGMDEVYQDVIKSFKTEGTAIVQIGFDTEGDLIPIERCELGEIFLDSNVDSISTDSLRKSRNALWVIREVNLKYSEFLNIFPHMEGKVFPGSPGQKETRDVFMRDSDENLEIKDSERIGVQYAYSISEKKNPIQAIYAGSNSVLVEDIKQGKDYPFWAKRRNGREYAFLPFVDFHYSLTKRGFYSMSMIGMMKDLAEGFRRILNASLPVFEKSVNKILFLFGAKDDQFVEEMQLALETQKLGLNPMIAVGNESARIESIAPDSIFSDFEAAKKVIFDEASDRFDIDFARLSQETVKATVFIGKTKTELQAISGLYTINRHGFNRIAKYVTSIAGKFWKKSDKRIVDVFISEEEIESVPLPLSDALDVIKEYDGAFETDVDIKIPLSSSDKAQAMIEMEQGVQNLFYNIPFQSIEEIDVDIDSLVKRAALRGLDDIYTKAKLIKKAQDIIKSRQQQQEALQAEAVGIEQEDAAVPQGNDVNRDVAAELSPNKLLAEANAV